MGNDPVSLEPFVSRFETEEACADYLFQVKWPDGFVCPRCDYRHFYKNEDSTAPPL
jgi:hypothetical protein